jgi:pyruvate dehydrogenase E1 component
LNGEGLQHEDGHSHLLAATNPAVIAYDPAFGFEIGHIVRDGLRRMYGDEPEDVFYYLTVYNEPYVQPAEPEGVNVEGILRGMHLWRRGGDGGVARAQLLASGVAVPWAERAQQLLREDWNVDADVWSVTSWTELRRDGLAVDEWNFMHPGDEPRTAYVTRALSESAGPVVAVSDFIRAVQDQIRDWVPSDFMSLGTDGFGLSDTRGALRRHFKVDAESIVLRTLEQLVKRGEVDASLPKQAFDRYRVEDVRAADPGAGMGDA